MEKPSHRGNQSKWEWAASLNWGALYLEKDLTVHLGNKLGAALLNIAYEPNRKVSLRECLSPQSEEYQMLSRMVTSNQELKSSLVLWETRGSIHHVILDSYSSSNDDGTVEGMHLLAKDLGDFMLAEQQLQRNDRLLTVGKVAAGVAHEVRNPLTTIKGFVQVLQSHYAAAPTESKTPEQLYIDMILAEIESLEFVVSDLLMLANPRKLNKTECDLVSLFDNLRPAIDNRIKANKANVHVGFQFDGLPRIQADVEMLTHAVMNIITNAIDAMAENQSGTDRVDQLTVHAHPVPTGIQIDISDTGPGIPYYQTDKIFDAFFTTKDVGVGLGLPICQRIIADHGGEIRISSKGYGTTFHVVLPLPSVIADSSLA